MPKYTNTQTTKTNKKKRKNSQQVSKKKPIRKTKTSNKTRTRKSAPKGKKSNYAYGRAQELAVGRDICKNSEGAHIEDLKVAKVHLIQE